MLVRNPSKIHGIGIFTTERIRRGLEFYTIRPEQVSDTPRARWAHLNGRWISDEVLNFVNHSCSPNSQINLEDLSLVALRDIPADHEITLDYNRTETGGEKAKCDCGSRNCRGYFLRIE